MTNEILRLVQARDYHMTDEEHLLLGPRGINIWYGYNYSHNDLTQANSLARKIRNDFPEIKYSSMQICIPTESVSKIHSGKLFLKIRVSLDQFLYMRKHKTFGIL